MENKIISSFLSSVLLLTACKESNNTDIKIFMEKEKLNASGYIDPLPKIEFVDSVTYNVVDKRSPFLPFYNTSMLEKNKAKRVNLDKKRPKERLEYMDFDGFKMVGTLSKPGRLQGILENNGIVYIVSVGDYLGKDHGRIISINREKMHIVETVPIGKDIWVERSRIISLDKKTKK